MPTIFRTAWLAGALAVLTVSASAQWRPYPDDDRYRRDRDYGYGRDDRYGRDRDDDYRTDRYGRANDSGWGRYRDSTNSGFSLFDRVQRNLDAAYRNQRSFGDRDQQRYANAQRNLDRFAATYQRGEWDNGRLNQAIEDVDNIFKNNRLDGRDRDRLSRDLADLRAFRSSRGNGGFSNGGYGNGPYNGGRRGPFGQPW